MVAAQRHQRADPGHRARHRRRQHPVPSDRRRQHRRRRLLKQILLRAGIILYGLRLTFQDIAGVGLHGVLLDALMLASTFGLACLLGTRLFGLDRTTTLLIGAGSSICGAAAVMATEPVVRGRAEQVAVAVSTVVVFGTLGIFLIQRCSSSTRTGGCYRATLAPGACTSVPRCTRWPRWSPRVARSA